MSSYLVFFLFGYIFGIYSQNNFISIIIYLILLIIIIMLILKKYVHVVIILVSFILGLFYMPNIGPNIDAGQDIVGECQVVQVHSKYLIIECANNQYIVYDYLDSLEGDVINVVGKAQEISSFDIPKVSTFKDYLYVHRIYYQLKISSWTIISTGSSLRANMINYLCSYLSNDSLQMIKLLVLNDKTDSIQLYDNLKSLSILQLFVISGFHINIMYHFIELTAGRFIKNKILLILLIFPYVWLLNFSLPVLRAFATLLVRTINKKYFNNYLDNMGCYCLVCISFLLYEPLYIFDYSFILTFFASFLLVFVQNIYYRKSIKSTFVSSAYIFIGLIPIICSMSYEINILGYLLNILLTVPVSGLYVFSLITAIIKLPDFIYSFIVNIFSVLLEWCTNIDTTIVFGKMNMFYIILFYLFYGLIVFFKESRQRRKCINSIVALSIILLCSSSSNYILDNSGVIFLDVGQGDATFIRGPHNSYNILIDTGGSIYTDYATQRLIPYFKAQGISSLDAVILTHDDYDHCGALDSLKTNFNVEAIYYGYEYESININGFAIRNLNKYVNEESTDNESSAVFLFELNDISYLVMGDAPIEVEKEIIDANINIDIDVLRIGHHGSKTSTSEELIHATTPEVAVISVGANNKYGFPNEEVIDILTRNNVTYRRTDLDGTIEIVKEDYLNLLLSNSI